MIMTIIIALKDTQNKRIILGSDRQGTAGQIKETVKDKIIKKDITITDAYTNTIDTRECYIGLAGHVFLSNYIKYNFTMPNLDENMPFIEYLYNYFLEELRKSLEEHKLLGDNNNVFKSDSAMIIVYDGEIYSITGRFSVEPVYNEYCVDGSGYEIAIGSLYTNLHYNDDWLPREDMVKQAIIACGANTVYCDTNINIEMIPYD